MLIAEIQDALNNQINAEFQAFYTYLSMSAYFEAQNLPGFAAWMHHHATEEQGHAMRLYNFINERRGRVKLQALSAPRNDWSSAVEVVQDALKHEEHVTDLINKLVDISVQHTDHATNSFLQWFVDEQVEEESIVDNLLQDLKRIGDYGPGLFMLDRELSGQVGASETSEE